MLIRKGRPVRKLKWLMPWDIYGYYLNHTTTNDGVPVVRILETLQSRLQVASYHNAKNIQHAIMEADRVVYKNVITGVETGEWVAFGRRQPEAEEEIIPQRYWPFLTLDVEARVAQSRSMVFRGVRGLFARQIPRGHPILEAIRVVQIIPNTALAPGVEPVPAPSPHPVAIKAKPPGRPSAMPHIWPEFERRAKAGVLEESLNREAELLAAWLKTYHPDAPPLTASTICGRIREKYHSAKSRLQNRPAGPDPDLTG